MDRKSSVVTWTIVGAIVLLVLFYWIYATREPRADREAQSQTIVTNFEDCLAAGYEVMESFPRQCRTPDGVTYTEEAGEDSTDAGGDTEVDADADLDLDNLSK